MKRIATILIAMVMLLACFTTVVRSQTPESPPESADAPGVPQRSPAELDQLLGPIALYPDPLLVEILTAATQPTQIVMADRFVQSGRDPSLVDGHLWDGSVKALVRYPDILKWLDDNLAWTSAVGDAFAAQPADVMDSVQRLRTSARDLGNLQTTAEQEVVSDNGIIEILPTEPETIYIPSYDPTEVYNEPPPPEGSWVVFGVGFPIGYWMSYDFDWRRHHVFIWPRNHPRPPGWWHAPPGHRHDPLPGEHGGFVWRPHPRSDNVLIGRSDRGWGQRELGDPKSGQPQFESRELPRPAGRPLSDAMVGLHSASEARSFSARGQESRSAPLSGGGFGGNTSHAGGGGSGGGGSGGGHSTGGGGGGGGGKSK